MGALGIPLRRFLSFLGQPGRIEVLEDRPDRFAGIVGHRRIVADRESHELREGAKTLAAFSDVAAVEIQHLYSGTERDFEWWEVSLRLEDSKRIRFPRLSDGVDASILAAKLGGVMEREVVALPEIG